MENRAFMISPQNPSSNSIPRTSLTSVVAEKLREKIVQGEIQEGEQLRQDAIAQEFAVSRIPVREALRQLEPEVLRASIPNLKESDFAAAEQILETYDNSLGDEGDISEWGRLNWQFHSTLYAGAHRPQFMNVIRNINFNGERYIRLQLYLTRALERARKEHHMLLSLCRKRQIDRACELLASHIRTAGKSLSQFVTEHRQQKEQGGVTNASSSASAA